MGETTGIEWTGPNGKTWSPVFGCTKVHTGCLNCYAEDDNARYKRNGGTWGKGAPRVLRKDWDSPLKWARAAAKAGQRWKVFPSLCDPFDAEWPAGALEQFADLIWGTAKVCGECGPTLEAGHDLGCSRPENQQGGLDWLLLTKRPERAHSLMPHIRRLVWLLVSVSDQATADKYVPLLLATEGFRLRGISYEPAVGPLSRLDAHLWRKCRVCDGSMSIPVPGGGEACGACLAHQGEERALDWVIVGGESGHKRRPFEIAWAESVAAQCKLASVPVFMKQDSAFLPGQRGRFTDALWALKQFPKLEAL